MGQIGFVIGELIMIIGGLASFLIFGSYYSPKFKSEKERERHLELIKGKGKKFKIIGLLLLLFGVFRLISKIL